MQDASAQEQGFSLLGATWLEIAFAFKWVFGRFQRPAGKSRKPRNEKHSRVGVADWVFLGFTKLPAVASFKCPFETRSQMGPSSSSVIYKTLSLLFISVAFGFRSNRAPSTYDSSMAGCFFRCWRALATSARRGRVYDAIHSFVWVNRILRSSLASAALARSSPEVHRSVEVQFRR